MNIHPALVHFPIVLTILYALFELWPLLRSPALWMEPTRRFLLYAATVTAIPTVAAGLLASNAVGGTPLIEVHENAALIFLGMLVVASALDLYRFKKMDTATLLWLQRALALLALVLVFIVGALGGAVAYGPDFDPFTHFVYGLFF